MTNQRLHHYVQDRLEGKVHDAGGREVAGRFLEKWLEQKKNQ